MAKATPSGAHYLDGATRKRKSVRSRFTAFVSVVATLAVVGLTLGMGSLVSAESRTSENTQTVVADAFFCGTIGANMDERGPWRSMGARTLPQVSGRYFTLPEVVGNGVWWSTFHGTGGKGEIFMTPYDEIVEPINAERSTGDLPLTSALPADLQKYRNMGNCTFASIPIFLGNVGLNFANVIAGVVGWIATTSFNPSFICDADPVVAASNGPCIDIIGVIGGRSNDASQGGTGEGSASGIIGALTTGLYKPLVILIVIISALLVAWTGIVKRQFRQAFGQAAWVAISFIIGLVLVLNPSMLVKAPMVAGNTVLGCIIGAFTGSGGCVTSGASLDTTDQPTNKAVCVSGARGATAAQQTTFYINSMSCSIWSAFVLEPYARGAFGTGVSGLEMDSAVDGGSNTVSGILSAKGWNYGDNVVNAANSDGNPENYCVRLGNNSYSYNTMPDRFQGTDGPKICNLAVWDLMMKVNYSGGGINASHATPDASWFELLSRIPASEQLSSNYLNDGGGGWNKFLMGTVAWVAALAGGFIIGLTSLAALVYYVMSMVMIAFAPVFFLIGLHPGRGKRLMLGWVEQIISNFLKYLVSAVFVLIAITFYGAILGSGGGLEGSILFIILVTAALLMYRKELINMLGRVDMGGQKMTDAADATLSGAKRKSDMAKRVATGVTAGALAGLGTRGLKGMSDGVKTATLRELRSGSGVVGRTLQAASAMTSDTKADMRSQANRLKEEADAANAQAAELSSSLAQAVNAAQPEAQKIADARDEVRMASERYEADFEEANAAYEEQKPIEDYDNAVMEIVLSTGLDEKSPHLVSNYSKYLQDMEKRDIYQNSADNFRAIGNHEMAAKMDIKVQEAEAAANSKIAQYSTEEIALAKATFDKAALDVFNNPDLTEEERQTLEKGRDMKNDIAGQSDRLARRDLVEESLDQSYELLVNAENKLVALQDSWAKGAGGKINDITQQLSAAKNNADHLMAQRAEMQKQLEEYVAGDVRSTRSINQDMEKAKAKATVKSSKANIGDANQRLLDEINELTGGSIAAATLGESTEKARQTNEKNIGKVLEENRKEEFREIRNEQLKDAVQNVTSAVKQGAATAVGAVGGLPVDVLASRKEATAKQHADDAEALRAEARRLSEQMKNETIPSQVENLKNQINDLQKDIREAQEKSKRAHDEAAALRSKSDRITHGVDTAAASAAQKRAEVNERREGRANVKLEVNDATIEKIQNLQIPESLRRSLEDQVRNVERMTQDPRWASAQAKLQQFIDRFEKLDQNSSVLEVQDAIRSAPVNPIARPGKPKGPEGGLPTLPGARPNSGGES